MKSCARFHSFCIFGGWQPAEGDNSEGNRIVACVFEGAGTKKKNARSKLAGKTKGKEPGRADPETKKR